MDDIPKAYHNPDPLENPMNAFRAIPGNFFNSNKKKGQPKGCKSLKSIVEIISTQSKT